MRLTSTMLSSNLKVFSMGIIICVSARSTGTLIIAGLLMTKGFFEMFSLSGNVSDATLIISILQVSLCCLFVTSSLAVLSLSNIVSDVTLTVPVLLISL